MTHAGTMDLGRNAQTKQSGSRLPAVMLTLAVVVAAIAAVWFASSAGLVGGTATKPAGVIAAQTGAKSLPDNLSARRGYPIAAQPAAIALPDNLSVRRGYAAVAVTPSINLWSWRGHTAGAVTLPDNLSIRRGYPVAAPAAVKALPDNSPARRRIAARAAAAALRALPDNLSSARRGYAAVAVTSPINLWSWRGHAAGAVTLPDNLSVRRGYAIEAQPSAIKLPDSLSLRGGYWVQIAAPSFSATSGTFHLGR